MQACHGWGKIIVTHVEGKHQTLAWFVKSFDKEDPFHLHVIIEPGWLGRKEIPIVDIPSVSVEVFPVDIWQSKSPPPHPNAGMA